MLFRFPGMSCRKPTSLASVSKVSAASPGMAKRSTPLFLNKQVAHINPIADAVRALPGLVSGGGGSSVAVGLLLSCLMMAASQSAILA